MDFIFNSGIEDFTNSGDSNGATYATAGESATISLPDGTEQSQGKMLRTEFNNVKEKQATKIAEETTKKIIDDNEPSFSSDNIKFVEYDSTTGYSTSFREDQNQKYIMCDGPLTQGSTAIESSADWWHKTFVVE